MTEAERAELVELLLKSEREFIQELEGLNELQWSFKLEPDRWSVGQISITSSKKRSGSASTSGSARRSAAQRFARSASSSRPVAFK